MKPVVLLLAGVLVLAGCGDDDTSAPPAAQPTSAVPEGPTTASPLKAACDYLDAGDVSEALHNAVEAVPKGKELCSWGELDLSVVTATQSDFDEERDINAADSDTPPPSLGLGEESYLIIGQAGGTGSAGVYAHGRKAVLALPGEVPAADQKNLLTLFISKIAGQL